MPNQDNHKVNRRKFFAVSATGLAGATLSVSGLPTKSDAQTNAPSPPPRTSIEITQYSVEWNQGTNKGRIAVLLKDNKMHTLNISSLAEAAGYAAILSQKNVVWWSDNSIGTIWQQTETTISKP
ncbi:MAG: hypothetical protein ABI954_12445 [Pyrinomonadaceae bacterium]